MDPEIEAIRQRKLARLAAEAVVPASPVTVTDATFAAFLRESPVAVVDFWAPWCGPCRYLGPILDDLARDLAGRVVVGKVNVDENPVTPGAFQVTGIPTLLVFREGRLVDRIVGAAPKEQLKARLLRHAG